MPRNIQWIVGGVLLLAIIALGSTYLTHHGVTGASKSEGASKTEANEAAAYEPAVRAALDAGNQAFKDGRYSDALDRFLDAEHAGGQLSNAQYDALKNARLQLAKIYEDGGDRSSSDKVYSALAKCAAVQAQLRYNQTKDYEGAVARTQDAEEFSSHLTDGKRDFLRSALFVRANSFLALKRYSGAIDAQRQYIDVIKSSDPDDSGLVLAYSGLVDLQAKAQDWSASRDSLLTMIDVCEKSARNERLMRNWAQYNLVLAYSHTGETDTALSKADEFYTEYASDTADGTRPAANVVYQPNQFASLALQIASNAKLPEAMEKWRKNGGVAQGSISTVAMHPGTQ